MAKIIFVNRFFYPDLSATSQLLSDLAFDLAAKDEVHVVTSRQSYDDASAQLPRVETIQSVRVWRIWTSRFGRGFLPARALDYLTFYVSALMRLLALTRVGDTIIAKTDPPMISVIAALVAKVRRAKLINWLQDVFPEIACALRVPGASMLSFLLTPLRNWSLRAADMNVVLGERMAKIVRENSKVDARRIAVIHNWADGEAIVPTARQENSLRKEWGLTNHFVVGYSGNMGRVHELGIILAAAEILLNDPRFIFLLVGSGARVAWLQDSVKLRNLKNVMFRPYQPRSMLGISLGACDAHIVSLNAALEGFVVPSKFYGIAAAGRPIINIGAEDGEISRIVVDSGCGATFSPTDAAGLTRFLDSLAEDATLGSKSGKRARKVFLDRFEKKRALEHWRAVIFSPPSNH